MTGELESKIISFLRFPLIAGVVLIHAYGGLTMQGKDMGSLNEYPINDAIQYLFSRILTSVCVPCFFFISGYLFYIKENDCYKNKIRKRIKTLLIPYLFWNALILLFFVCSTNLTIYQQPLFWSPQTYKRLLFPGFPLCILVS